MTTPLHLACYEDLRTWLRKRRRALLTAVGIVGTGCIVYYGVSCYRSRVGDKKAQEEEKKDALQKEAEDRVDMQLRYHFESIQRISDSTTLPSVIGQLHRRLFELVDITGVTEQLLIIKEDGASSQAKMQLWQHLKILSFTRAVCAIWAIGLVDLFVRIQLNVLGRHLYISTATDMASSAQGKAMEFSNEPEELPLSTQHKFLALADFLPYMGLQLLVLDARKAVESVLKGLSLKRPYSMDELRELFNKIRDVFEGGQKDWSKYVLPNDNSLPDELAAASSAADSSAPSPSTPLSGMEDEKFQQLIGETRDVLSSKEFYDVLGSVLLVVLDMVMDDLHLGQQGRVPLAKLLPPVANLGNLILENPGNNKYIQAIAKLPQVHSFCAMVYAST